MRSGFQARVATGVRLIVAGVLVLSCAPDASAQGSAELLSVLRNLPDRIPFPTDVVEAKSAMASRSEQIDPRLLALSDEVASRGMSSLSAFAEDLQVDVRDDLVAVTLLSEDSFGRDELEFRVRDEGGAVTGVFDNAVFAELPLDRIEQFEGDADLYYMTAQARFSHAPPDPDAFSPLGVEAGVEAIRVQRLHDQGIRGRGVKVGILDFGFEGYDALVQRGALPQPAAARAFTQSGTLENDKVHGTACAEIVHAVAPEAELYLAAVDGREGQIVAAAQWLVAQGVDIISFSGGGHWGPHNGTSVLDRLVDSIVEGGVLWVNAAGNEGTDHWGGTATDRNGDLVVELDGRWPGIAVQPSDGIVRLLAVWDDWGADSRRPTATQDIDAFLFEVDNRGQARLVAQSIRPQRGRGTPIEYIGYRGRPGAVYVMLFRATNLRRPVRLHVFKEMRSPMEPLVPEGSVGIPATARSALAVGAVHVDTGRLEPFSGQGPTDDGRFKPTVVAPDNTESLAYRGPFPGTSAACPYVAGFAALLKQLSPSADPEALTQSVQRHVRPLGGRSPNNKYGYGHIDGSDVEGDRQPTVTDERPPVVLPGFLGGRTSTRTLDDLWERAERRSSRFGLRVRVNQRPGRGEEPPRYRIGDPMKVGFATDVRCNSTLILRDARGEYRVMASSELEPDEPQLLPEEEGVSWTISEPIGREGFLLVCSRRDVDLDAAGLRGSEDDVDVAIAEYRVVR